jgi:ABC-2 type transport system permease protein
MATIAHPNENFAVRGTQRGSRLPFLAQVWLLMNRTLVVNWRTPEGIIPSIIIGVFFLTIYEASLGGASNFLPGLTGKSYLGFVLPFSVISGALSGAGVAGQSIVRDIEQGYFDKLMLTPFSRWALLLGPMLAGAVLLVVQTLVITGVAIVMGLRPETGVLGVLGLVGYALLLGAAFSGFTVGVALYSGSAAATQGASFLFFPLSFLTATFVPLNLLEGWIRVAATYNPITYILEATRALMLNPWSEISAEVMLRGVSACLAMGVVLFAFALFALRTRTRRK